MSPSGQVTPGAGANNCGSKMHPTILIIRPEEAAIRFEQELIARFGVGLRSVRAPVMRLEFLSPKVNWPTVKTLLFTSDERFSLLSINNRALGEDSGSM